jgi:hypothetical protein
MKRILIACLITTTLLVPGHLLRAEDQPAPVAGAKTTAAKPKQMPFRGKISEINKTDRTITLAGKEKSRTFKVMATTRIHRDGTTLAFDDVKTGSMVGGLARANEAGTWEIVTLNLGIKGSQPKPDESAAEESEE